MHRSTEILEELCSSPLYVYLPRATDRPEPRHVTGQVNKLSGASALAHISVCVILLYCGRVRASKAKPWMCLERWQSRSPVVCLDSHVSRRQRKRKGRPLEVRPFHSSTIPSYNLRVSDLRFWSPASPGPAATEFACQ